jgi:hypothetical protein
MELLKHIKVMVIAGATVGATLLLLVDSPVNPTKELIVAASAEEPSPEERAEEARQQEVQKQYDELIEEATAPANQTVAGVKSDVGGYYLAKEVQGVALTPSTGAGTAKDSFVKVLDVDKSKSTAAVAVAENAAAAIAPNAQVGPCISVTYGKKNGENFVQSTDGSSGTLNIGIPANFRSEGATYSVVAVYGGGAYKVFENTSTDPAKFTANVDAALTPNVMYALVKH